MTDTPPTDPSPASEPASNPESGPGPGTAFRIFPAHGQAFPVDDPSKPVSPEDYRAKILPNLLTRTNDQPDQLHEVLVGALRIGANEEAETGARRLMELDGDAQRSLAVFSVALIQNKKADEAERLLRERLDADGQDPAPLLRLQLAKALAVKGDTDGAEDELWESLELDPNHPDAVLWWGRMMHEAEPDGGFYRAMQQIEAIDGSWFARLWMARLHLEDKDIDSALPLYEQSLPQAAANPEALAMITGDLGKAGAFQDAVRLVEPHYDPKRHGPLPGLNLAVACARTGDKPRGRELLGRVEALGIELVAPQIEQVRQILQG
jgi:tetratricopeptide (TPR) repeat protein